MCTAFSPHAGSTRVIIVMDRNKKEKRKKGTKKTPSSNLTTEKRGRPHGGSLFENASLLYWEAVIKYHPVSDIVALQQHDTVERGYYGGP